MKLRIIFLVFSAAIISAGCAGDFSPMEFGTADSQQAVLIAGQASDFKAAVVEGLAEKLAAGNYYVKVGGLGRLDREQTDRFGAIILVCQVAGGAVPKAATDFIAAHPNDGRIILFASTGGEPKDGWKPSGVETDAVSSPSKTDRVPAVVEELISLIEARF